VARPAISSIAVDYSPNSKDTFHLNLFLARNTFQTPNQFDQQALGQDQRQLVHSLNIAPGYVHIFSATTVLSVNPYYRLDKREISLQSQSFFGSDDHLRRVATIE